MIEFLSNLSLLIGLIVKGASYLMLIFVLMFGVFYILKKTPDSNCNHDCNQGRNCKCKGK